MSITAVIGKAKISCFKQKEGYHVQNYVKLVVPILHPMNLCKFTERHTRVFTTHTWNVSRGVHAWAVIESLGLLVDKGSFTHIGPGLKRIPGCWDNASAFANYLMVDCENGEKLVDVIQREYLATFK